MAASPSRIVEGEAGTGVQERPEVGAEALRQACATAFDWWQYG
ncbi:hypothetical protein [Kitasatospora phosalacinea]|nr:hypothetical protein [Kitasatospora phosalacinea]